MNGLNWYEDLGSRWVEVDAGALAWNVNQVLEQLSLGARLLAVVKADGYGCGAVEVARIFLQAGAAMLGVTTLEEGLELRRAGLEAPVLVLGPLLRGQLLVAIRAGLTVTASSATDLQALAAAAEELASERGTEGVPTPRITAHLEVDTGLGRSGIFPEEVPDLVRLALEKCQRVYLEGIFTHLASARSPGSAYALSQWRRFQHAINLLTAKELPIPPLKHVCNSSAMLLFPQMHLDLVRVGTLLYGQFPAGLAGFVRNRLDLRDAFRVKARILQRRSLPPGWGVGYGPDFVTGHPTEVAVISLGFADGLGITPVSRPKSLPDLLRYFLKVTAGFLGVGQTTPGALVAGRPVKFIGRHGMSHSVLNINGAAGADVGAEVELRLPRVITASRLPRLYLRSGQPYLWRSPQGEYLPLQVKEKPAGTNCRDSLFLSNGNERFS